jgi:hypothetical protein
MAFPHPKSRKDKCRKEDKPDGGGVVWDFFKRTINIAEYRNGKDDVDPANDRTFDALVHDAALHDFVRIGDDAVEARRMPSIMA